MASNSKPGLFERIFKYPASSNRPTENLATEVTAFFLDHYPPLLQGFLQAIDNQLKTAFSKAGGGWKIDTQKQIDADQGYGVADLLLWVGDPPTHKIVVEAKIDAPPSDPQQTQRFAEHLEKLRMQHQTETALVLLTRWKASGDLAKPCSAKLLFKDFKKLLREASPSGEATERAISFFALSWAEYLEKEWCVPDITPKVLESLIDMSASDDLKAVRTYLEQALYSTAAALTGGGWRSRGSRPVKDRGNNRQQVWGLQLFPLFPDVAVSRDDFIQIGCDFGAESNWPVIRGLVYLHGKYTEASSQFQLSDDILNPRDKSGHVAMLSDILEQGIPASLPGEPIDDAKLAGQLQKDLVKAVRKLETP